LSTWGKKVCSDFEDKKLGERGVLSQHHINLERNSEGGGTMPWRGGEKKEAHRDCVKKGLVEKKWIGQFYQKGGRTYRGKSLGQRPGR